MRLAFRFTGRTGENPIDLQQARSMVACLLGREPLPKLLVPNLREFPDVLLSQLHVVTVGNGRERVETGFLAGSGYSCIPSTLLGTYHANVPPAAVNGRA